MKSATANTGNARDRLHEQRRFSKGKDHLNFADWRIGLTKFETPRKADGGKLDYIETVICRSGKPDQKLTKMSPSVVGLPTPVDDDVFLALLTLARQSNFASDIVHFSPLELFEILRWTSGANNYKRLDQSLTRLCAVTMRFEYIWYDKVKADVEPILTTGILAESNLVCRRGRKKRDSTPDSYIQWTNYLYNHIQGGNLTNIDLDLYFSLTRPGSRFLYRHLNKRWHGKRKGRPYERDLKDLACGHLGLRDTKDLKRNLEAIIADLQSSGYLQKDSVHFVKVCPGRYRVRFDPQEESPKAEGKRATAAMTDTVEHASEEGSIVQSFHKQWSQGSNASPTASELKYARQLLDQHGLTLVEKLLPKVVSRLEKKWPDCKTFFGSRRYFEQIITEYESKKRIDEKRHVEDLATVKQQESIETAKQQRRKRAETLLAEWNTLPEDEKRRMHEQAIAAIPYDVLRDCVRKKSTVEAPATQVLDYFAKKRGLPPVSRAEH